MKTKVEKGVVKILKVDDNGEMLWYDIRHTVDIIKHFPDTVEF